MPRWPGWRHLPRDTRDTLFLLGVIGWTVLPHLAHLPLWCALLTGAGAALARPARARQRAAARPLGWSCRCCCVAAGLTLWTHRTLLGKEAGVTMLVVLMALKTLELRARRDAFVVFFLGFFVVLTQFLYSQSLPVAAAMLVSVWGLLTALVLAHMPVGQPACAQAAALSARCALLGAPLMVAAVRALPAHRRRCGACRRTTAGEDRPVEQHAAWARVAELAIDDSVALRAALRRACRRRREALYFRGPVLSRFDGREWKRVRCAALRRARRDARRTARSPARRCAYEMTLEPQRLRLLPLLEMAPATADAHRASRACACSAAATCNGATDRPVTERLRFDAAGLAALSPRPARARAGAARRPRPARRLQPAHAGLGRGAAPRAALCRRRRARALAQARAAAHPQRRLQLHADARHLRRRRAGTTRSTSSGSTASTASASTSPPPSSS